MQRRKQQRHSEEQREENRAGNEKITGERMGNAHALALYLARRAGAILIYEKPADNCKATTSNCKATSPQRQAASMHRRKDDAESSVTGH